MTPFAGLEDDSQSMRLSAKSGSIEIKNVRASHSMDGLQCGHEKAGLELTCLPRPPQILVLQSLPANVGRMSAPASLFVLKD